MSSGRQPAEPGGERGDQSAAGSGYGGQRLAAALQRPIRCQHRHRNVESHRAAKRLRRQRARHEHSAADDVDAAAIGDADEYYRTRFDHCRQPRGADQHVQPAQHAEPASSAPAKHRRPMQGSARRPAWRCRWARSFRRIGGYSTTATTVGTTLTLAQSVLTQLGDCRQFGAAVGQSSRPRSRSTTTGRRRRSSRPQAISIRFFRCSIPRPATLTCSRVKRVNTPVGRQFERHSQRQWLASGPDAGHGRAPAGGSGRRAGWGALSFRGLRIDGVDQRGSGARGLAVRLQARAASVQA